MTQVKIVNYTGYPSGESPEIKINKALLDIANTVNDVEIQDIQLGERFAMIRYRTTSIVACEKIRKALDPTWEAPW